MPDLSKRPERYATVAVALMIVGGFAYSSLDIHLGPDRRVAELQSANEQLLHKLDAGSSRSTVSASPSASPSGPTSTTVVSHKNCSAFGSQEAAQKYWVQHKAEYPGWDGNHNGIACEQLKSTRTSTAPHSTVTVSTTELAGVTNPDPNSSVSSEPKAPTAAPTTSSAPRKPTAPSKAVIVASRQHFGLYAGTQDEYDAVESTLARDTTMHGYFQGWDSDFRADSVNAAWSAGEIPFLTWESRSLNDDSNATDYSLSRIASGAFDPYLTKYADAIVANGLPLVIRFDQEMNGNWYRWGEPNTTYNNPKGSYIAAWRHVHDIFQARGANNLVVWEWSPNRIDNIRRYPSIDNYYPGDSYVDWVGMTGYYRPGDAAPTFSSTYDATLTALRTVAPGKPILLSEIGATETGNHKLDWVKSFFAGLPTEPDVIGFVWFNYAVTASSITNDWRITSSSDVTNAFRAGLYADGFGRDHGKKPILVTTVPTPTATPSATPSASVSASRSASASPSAAPSATA